MLWGGTGPTLHRYTWLALPQVIPWPGLVLCDPLYPFCKTVMTTVLLHRVALGLKETGGVRALCTTSPGGVRRAGLRPVILRRLVQWWGPPGLSLLRPWGPHWPGTQQVLRVWDWSSSESTASTWGCPLHSQVGPLNTPSTKGTGEEPCDSQRRSNSVEFSVSLFSPQS